MVLAGHPLLPPKNLTNIMTIRDKHSKRSEHNIEEMGQDINQRNTGEWAYTGGLPA